MVACEVLLATRIFPCDVHGTFAFDEADHLRNRILGLSGSHFEGLSYTPGNVKLWESTGIAGGLPLLNYYISLLCIRNYLNAEIFQVPEAITTLWLCELIVLCVTGLLGHA
jgi:hypothetical protein